jgi:hypothetical protein
MTAKIPGRRSCPDILCRAVTSASTHRLASIHARLLSSPSDRPSPRPHGLWRLLPRENLSASVYGTSLVSSVIVGLAGTDLAAGAMMAALAVTALVFALAHAWSRALARASDDRQALALGHILDGIRHEWPMVEAVTPGLIALGFAALGVYSESTGLWIGITANTVLLFAWGAILRHRAAGSALEFIGAGLTTAMLGLALVALKAFVH